MFRSAWRRLRTRLCGRRIGRRGIGPGTLILRPRARWRCSTRRRRRCRTRRCHRRQRPRTTIAALAGPGGLVPAGSAEATIRRALEVGIRVEVETRAEAGLVRTTEPRVSYTGGFEVLA